MNVKKFCIISDIHFCDEFVTDINKGLRECFFPYLRESVDELSAVIIAGDLFHKKLTFGSVSAYSVLNFLTKTLKILKGKPLIVIGGTRSHDFKQLSTFKFLESKGLTIIETADEMEIDDVPILFLPEEYPTDGLKHYGFESKLKEDEQYGMIVLHGMIDFAAYASSRMESEKIVPSAVTFPSKMLSKLAIVTVAGHVHTPMDHENIHYCGSFNRFAFGEEEDKGFIEVDIDLDSSTYELYRIQNTCAPTFKTIKFSKVFEGDIEKALLKVKKLEDKYDNLRIEIDMELDEKVNTAVAVMRESFPKVKLKLTRIRKKKIEDTLPEQVVQILKDKADVKQTITELIKQNHPEVVVTEEYVGMVISKK